MATIDWALTWNTVLAIATAIMALAIVIMAIFAMVQLWNFMKASHSTILMQLDKTWASKDYIDSRRMINRCCRGSTPEEAPQKLKESMISFDKTDAEEYFIILRVADFFENLGFLTSKGYLNRNDALGLLGSATKNYWYLFSAWTNYERYERCNPHPNEWEYFEKLALEFPNEKGLK